MTDTNEQLIEALDAPVERRNDRREFFKSALGAAAVAGAAASAITLGGIATAAEFTDKQLLNFVLNLEYLEAQFYSYAVFGTGLANADLAPGGDDGTGTQGAVTGGAQVTFTDPLVAQYAKEIAQDKIAHVRFLRALGALGTAAVAQPAIDIGVTPTSAFSKLAQAASVVTAGTGFNVYASDENFLLGAFMFADVGVTAYKGLTPLLTDANDLAAVAGILATKAYHASLIRTVLYAKGATTAALRTNADAISNARDVLDGAGATREFDQGISPTGTGTTLQSNITPLDGNGLAFSRTTGQVLNIVYLTSASVTAGGFYPAGLNGNIRTSAASATST